MIGKSLVNMFQFYLFCYVLKRLNIKRTFMLDNKEYGYFYHPHGSCFNERCIELSLVLDKLKDYDPNRVLEVGNVIGMYQPVYHNVLDKYDRSIGVINKDVVDFDYGQRYDFIFSISTIEHVGYDESDGVMLHQPEKTLEAVSNLKKLLEPDGLLLVTMPLGYRTVLDEQIMNNSFDFTGCFFMRRMSVSNIWVEVSREDVMEAMDGYPYPLVFFNHPFPKANWLFIGVYQK